MYTLRNVRFLVLKKGGDSLLIVTYSPFLRNKSLTVPLKEVSKRKEKKKSFVLLYDAIINQKPYYFGKIMNLMI